MESVFFQIKTGYDRVLVYLLHNFTGVSVGINMNAFVHNHVRQNGLY